MQAILSEEEYAEYLQLKQSSTTHQDNVDNEVASYLRRIAGMIPKKSFMATEDFIEVIEDAAIACEMRLQPKPMSPERTVKRFQAVIEEARKVVQPIMDKRKDLQPEQQKPTVATKSQGGAA